MLKYEIIFLLFLITSLFSISGCSPKQQEAESQADTEPLLPFSLPVSFTGQIDCDTCEYVHVTLNLRSDGLYQLRKKYVYSSGETETESQMRLWRYDAGEQLIVLGKNPGSLKTYQVVDQETLRFLDKENTETKELSDYELYKQTTIDPFYDVVKIRGMYAAGSVHNVLRECSSGVTFRVDPSADFYAMDRQYRSIPHQKEEGLLVSFQGHLVSGNKANKSPEILVVDRFNRIYPDQDCSGYKTKKGLIGPTWVVTEIAGQSLQEMEHMQPPFFTLNADTNQVSGFAGCNRFHGTYLFKGEIFIFNKIASTRMACPKGTSVERAFFEALDSTESFEIQDDTLYLKNNRDESVLTLHARN